jgi:DNA-binding winged helix-turn-helix (wHTH) protein
MPDPEPFNAAQRRRRRWLFADCIFDESRWNLSVDGRRVAIETKPLEVLRALLLRGGELVSKGELLDLIWPDVTVVEASLTTAVHKLRLAIADEQRNPHIVQTVPKIGYRIGVPIEVEESSAADRSTSAASRAGPASAIEESKSARPLVPLAVTVSLGVALLIGLAVPLMRREAAATRVPLTQSDARNALRKLDVGTIERMLAAGWDPNRPLDAEGNTPINMVLGKCEWDRGHDQEQMVLMVRTLVDGGGRLDHRNVWGDTPYSIAKAVRYCGPNHPVTQSIREMCFAGYKPLGDRCLASYELTRTKKQALDRPAQTQK